MLIKLKLVYYPELIEIKRFCATLLKTRLKKKKKPKWNAMSRVNCVGSGVFLSKNVKIGYV